MLLSPYRYSVFLDSSKMFWQLIAASSAHIVFTAMAKYSSTSVAASNNSAEYGVVFAIMGGENILNSRMT